MNDARSRLMPSICKSHVNPNSRSERATAQVDFGEILPFCNKVSSELPKTKGLSEILNFRFGDLSSYHKAIVQSRIAGHRLMVGICQP